MTAEQNDPSDDDIPEKVREELDEHEQEVYREAYNTAREGGSSLDESHNLAVKELEKQHDSQRKDDYEFLKR